MLSRIDYKSSQLIERTNRIGVQFLFADLDLGLTFLGIALSTGSPAFRSRSLDRAGEVYRTVTRLLPRVVPTPAERVDLQNKLSELRNRLQAAGYSFEN
jgi:hypothetical protein